MNEVCRVTSLLETRLCLANDSILHGMISRYPHIHCKCKLLPAIDRLALESMDRTERLARLDAALRRDEQDQDELAAQIAGLQHQRDQKKKDLKHNAEEREALRRLQELADLKAKATGRQQQLAAEQAENGTERADLVELQAQIDQAQQHVDERKADLAIAEQETNSLLKTVTQDLASLCEEEDQLQRGPQDVDAVGVVGTTTAPQDPSRRSTAVGQIPSDWQAPALTKADESAAAAKRRRLDERRSRVRSETVEADMNDEVATGEMNAEINARESTTASPSVANTPYGLGQPLVFPGLSGMPRYTNSPSQAGKRWRAIGVGGEGHDVVRSKPLPPLRRFHGNAFRATFRVSHHVRFLSNLLSSSKAIANWHKAVAMCWHCHEMLSRGEGQIIFRFSTAQRRSLVLHRPGVYTTSAVLVMPQGSAQVPCITM